MCDPEEHGDGAPNRLSNRDALHLPDELSLSDSDPDDNFPPFDQRVEDLSSSSDEDEVKVKGHRQPGVPPPTLQPAWGRGDNEAESAFQLRGGSLSFSDRSRNIFESLESAVKLASPQLGDDNVLSGTFARPAPPSPPPLARGGRKSGGSPGRVPPKKQQTQTAPVPASKVPDYLAHPERWTRYSLDDVPDTSDRSNSQVAHQFIQGLQEQRRRGQDEDRESFMPSFNQSQGSGDQHKILFSKPRLGPREEGGPTGLKAARLRKPATGLLLHGEPQDEEEGTGPDKALHGKRKWAPSEGWGDEDDPEDETEKPTGVSFNISSKKVNRKHFRKMAEPRAQEEEEED